METPSREAHANAVQTLIVLALVFASFVAIFALQNAQTVPIRIFAWERETSVAVIVLAAAAFGALTAVLAGLVRQVRAGIRIRQLRGELAKVNKLLAEERERAGELENRVSAPAVENQGQHAPGPGPQEKNGSAGVETRSEEAGPNGAGDPGPGRHTQ